MQGLCPFIITEVTKVASTKHCTQIEAENIQRHLLSSETLADAKKTRAADQTIKKKHSSHIQPGSDILLNSRKTKIKQMKRQLTTTTNFTVAFTVSRRVFKRKVSESVRSKQNHYKRWSNTAGTVK